MSNRDFRRLLQLASIILAAILALGKSNDWGWFLFVALFLEWEK